MGSGPCLRQCSEWFAAGLSKVFRWPSWLGVSGNSGSTQRRKGATWQKPSWLILRLAMIVFHVLLIPFAAPRGANVVAWSALVVSRVFHIMRADLKGL